MRIKIPLYAKRAALQGLNNKKIMSLKLGRRKAKQLIESNSIGLKQINNIIRYYQQYKNCRSKRCELAIKLCGGRRFCKFLTRAVKRVENEVKTKTSKTKKRRYAFGYGY